MLASDLGPAFFTFGDWTLFLCSPTFRTLSIGRCKPPSTVLALRAAVLEHKISVEMPQCNQIFMQTGLLVPVM